MIDIIAAGGVVRNSRGETLIMFRREMWDLPKGKAEEGETIAETALREVSEETGIPIEALELGRQIKKTIHEYDTYGAPMRKITSWFEMRLKYDVPLIPQTEEEITELRWVKNPQNLEPMWDNIRKILDSKE